MMARFALNTPLHQFSLFQSHIDLAHMYWERALQDGNWAIDATCGNGKDTLKLAKILKGRGGEVIALDIQSQAITRTQELLSNHSGIAKVHLYCQSHAVFPSLAYEHPIRLIVYNLGYLPGSDKTLTTMTDVTLQSVSTALDLLMPGGLLCITCYPGHFEGAREQEALLTWSSNLNPTIYNVCIQDFINRFAAPSLLTIQKSVFYFI